MSIINTVLKEIDQQQKSYRQSTLKPSATVQLDSTSKKGLLFLFVVVLIVMLGIAYRSSLLALWEHQEETKGTLVTQDEQTPKVRSSPKTVSQSLTLKNKSEELVVPAPVNHINSFYINESDQGIELVFKLDKEPVNYLKSYQKGMYVYHLAHVESLIQMDEWHKKEWFDSIQLRPTPSGVDVVIKTAAHVLLKSQWLQERAQSALWRISMSKKSRQEEANEPIVKLQPQVEVTKTVALIKPVVPKIRSQAKPEIQKQVIEKKQLIKTEGPVKLEIKPKQEKVTLEQKLQRAQVAILRQDWTVASKILKPLLLSKLDYSARKRLIKVYNSSARGALAQQLIREGLSLYPNDVEFSYLAAKQAYQKGNYVNSYHYLSEIAEHTALTQALLGKSLQRIGQHEKAIAAFNASLKQQEDPLLWVSLAISLEQTKQYKLAIKAYTHAINTGALTEKLQQFAQVRLKQLQQ